MWRDVNHLTRFDKKQIARGKHPSMRQTCHLAYVADAAPHVDPAPCRKAGSWPLSRSGLRLGNEWSRDPIPCNGSSENKRPFITRRHRQARTDDIGPRRRLSVHAFRR